MEALGAHAGHQRLERSLNNPLLIALQRPDATFVAGFKRWLALGYCVRRGERALRILAPIPLGQRDDDADSDAAGDGQDGERRWVAFKATAVFDRAQVDPLPEGEPTPLEPPCEPLSGDSHAHLLEPLRTFCTGELGYTVELRALPGAVGGWCDRKARHIVIDAGVPANAELRTLIHETAHALGVNYETHTREQAEVIVDCTTYIVCASVGLDVGGESIPYIAGWGEDDQLAAVTEFAGVIDALARRLEDTLDEQAPQTTGGA